MNEKAKESRKKTFFTFIVSKRMGNYEGFAFIFIFLSLQFSS